jgi:hypothetical protein
MRFFLQLQLRIQMALRPAQRWVSLLACAGETMLQWCSSRFYARLRKWEAFLTFVEQHSLGWTVRPFLA